MEEEGAGFPSGEVDSPDKIKQVTELVEKELDEAINGLRAAAFLKILGMVGMMTSPMAASLLFSVSELRPTFWQSVAAYAGILIASYGIHISGTLWEYKARTEYIYEVEEGLGSILNASDNDN